MKFSMGVGRMEIHLNYVIPSNSVLYARFHACKETPIGTLPFISNTISKINKDR